MQQRSCSLMVLGFVFAISLTPTVGQVQTADVVRLLGWEQDGAYHTGGGPGRDSFELTARAAWPRGLSGRFELRLTLPDGRIEAQPLTVEPGQTPRRVAAFVPAGAVRNLRPAAVRVGVQLVDSAGAAASNRLEATIVDFPRPRPVVEDEVETGPYGWGAPLTGRTGEAQVLPRPGPLGLRFVRIPGAGSEPGFFLAATEADNGQVGRLLADYDPRAGRSDEFLLEAANQPAVGLTPRRAQAALARLSQVDPSGVVYRLPTTREWMRAARAGRSTEFWWGAEPAAPGRANFLGPDPDLPTDATAPVRSGSEGPQFAANPWGLLHTFGNAAEWTTEAPARFARLGGHFRTEPSEARSAVTVVEADSTGPDPYVGVRPAFDLDAQAGAALVRKALASDPALARLQVRFDPDRATATLTGTLPDSKLRRQADRALAPLWFLAAVENQVATPAAGANRLASLGGVSGPVRRAAPLGRRVYEVPIEVRWSDPLPVIGSEWWVNIFLPGGGGTSHRLMTVNPDRSRRVTVSLDAAWLAAAGLAPDAPVAVALSLGGQASAPTDPRIVSNVVPLRWRLK